MKYFYTDVLKISFSENSAKGQFCNKSHQERHDCCKGRAPNSFGLNASARDVYCKYSCVFRMLE